MADAKSFERARTMRRNLTIPEARLWACLKGRGLNGLKFRRQHPIGPYILDFYCADRKLAVEVDGSSHEDADQARHDLRRTKWLEEKGVRVHRVAAVHVRDNLESVLVGIRIAADAAG